MAPSILTHLTPLLRVICSPWSVTQPQLQIYYYTTILPFPHIDFTSILLPATPSFHYFLWHHLTPPILTAVPVLHGAKPHLFTSGLLSNRDSSWPDLYWSDLSAPSVHKPHYPTFPTSSIHPPKWMPPRVTIPSPVNTHIFPTMHLLTISVRRQNLYTLIHFHLLSHFLWTTCSLSKNKIK